MKNINYDDKTFNSRLYDYIDNHIFRPYETKI